MLKIDKLWKEQSWVFVLVNTTTKTKSFNKMGKGWLDTALKYNGGEDGEEVAAQRMCKHLVHRFREHL